MIVWIYNIFTTDQMWYKCVGICDIITIVKIKLSFTIIIGNVTNVIFSNTFLPHLISSKYIVNPYFHAVGSCAMCGHIVRQLCLQHANYIMADG